MGKSTDKATIEEYLTQVWTKANDRLRFGSLMFAFVETHGNGINEI